MADPEIEELLRRILEEEGSTPPPTTGGTSGPTQAVPRGYYPQPASYYQTPTPSIPDVQPPDTGVPEWVDAEYQAALKEYYDALKAFNADSAPYFGTGTRPSQTRLTNARQRLQAVESIKKGYDKSSGRTPEQDALAAAQAKYYEAQAANVGQATPRTYLPGEAEATELKNRQMEMELAGTDPRSLQWLQTFGQNREEFAYKQQQDALARQQRQQDADLARKQSAWRMASDMVDQRMKAAPYALMPGQTHVLGYEPGGSASVNYGKLGLPFNAERYKVPAMKYDPEEAWRRALGMMG